MEESVTDIQTFVLYVLGDKGKSASVSTCRGRFRLSLLP